jgi:hypothetical protein
MSKISEQLLKYAQEEKQAHEQYVKDFSTVAIAQLVQGGVERDKAIVLTKEACFRNSELVKSVTRANVLEKTAQYIEAIEEENVKLAAKLEAMPSTESKPVQIPEHIKKLAALGFSEDELQAMESVPTKVLEKVAKVAESADEFSLGKAAGLARPQTDPFLEFLLS